VSAEGQKFITLRTAVV